MFQTRNDELHFGLKTSTNERMAYERQLFIELHLLKALHIFSLVKAPYTSIIYRQGMSFTFVFSTQMTTYNFLL